MNIVDFVFPYIEEHTAEQSAAFRDRLNADIEAIKGARFSRKAELALSEAQRIAAAEHDRFKTAENKATAYLAVLAALVPLILAIQTSAWGDSPGPAPEELKLSVLGAAMIYVAAAGYHAFRALQVAGYEKVDELGLVQAFRTPSPQAKLAKSTLLATRRSRDAVNAKLTRIRVTHAHLIRALLAFVILMLLDPISYPFADNGVVQSNTVSEPSPAILSPAPAASETPPLPPEVEKAGANTPAPLDEETVTTSPTSDDTGDSVD